MAEKLGHNCVIVGSFNPVHLGHIDMIRQGFQYFDVVNLFVRYNEGIDLTDWTTKKKWFERMNAELFDGKMRIFKTEPDEKGKNYGIQLFLDFIRSTESIVGEPIDGFVFGGDYDKLVPELEKEFPGMKFIITPREEGWNSTDIRRDLDGHKDWILPYVYEDLKKTL